MGLGANATDPAAVTVHGSNPQVHLSARRPGLACVGAAVPLQGAAVLLLPRTHSRGIGAQFLMEKILRQKIQNDAYWKEYCFALTAETIVDRYVSRRSGLPARKLISSCRQSAL